MGIFLLPFLLPLIVKTGLSTGENDNVFEFATLCRIYRLASQEIKDTSETDLRTGRAKVTELRAMYALAASDQNVSQESISQIPEDIKGKVKELPVELKEFLALKLKRITAKATTLEKELDDSQSTVTTATQAVKEALVDTIFGTGAAKISDIEGKLTQNKKIVLGATASLTGSTNCGGDGNNGSHGTHVGISLVNDFICLCIAHQSGEDNQCANSVDQADAGQDPFADGYTDRALAKWADIKTACPESKAEISAEAIGVALEAFRRTLGRQPLLGTADTNGVSPYILGKNSGSSSFTCDTKQNKVCVNYAHKLKKGKEGIPWEEKLKKAQKELQNIQTEQQKQAKILTKLEALTEKARDACDEVWERTQIAVSSQAAIPGNKGGSEKGEPIQKTLSADAQNTPSDSGNEIVGLAKIVAAILLMV